MIINETTQYIDVVVEANVDENGIITSVVTERIPATFKNIFDKKTQSFHMTFSAPKVKVKINKLVKS